jgi:Kdo2-lipid IVA lauroyltransferase/acyltransferase
MTSRIAIALMRLLARLPLPVLRLIGTGLGHVLFVLAVKRRRVVEVNLGLCYPDRSQAERRAMAVDTFIHFAQAWLDRGWLWHASPRKLQKRLQVEGDLSLIDSGAPIVIFAPHFVGLDAGWTALTLKLRRPMTTIYSEQADPVVDAWIHAGRRRFGSPRLFGRADGLKAVVRAIRQGEPLYLLPDMNITRQESVFVPFYGVATATLTSLARFARMGAAQVVPVTTRMTASGYTVQVLAAWTDFPGDDLQADAALMNRRLETWIDAMPTQYYWVHKRFKVRPPGQAPVY